MRIRFRIPHWQSATRWRDSRTIKADPNRWNRYPTRADVETGAARQVRMLNTIAECFGMTFAEADGCMRSGTYIICRPKQFGLYMAKRMESGVFPEITGRQMEVTTIPTPRTGAKELDVSGRTP